MPHHQNYVLDCFNQFTRFLQAINRHKLVLLSVQSTRTSIVLDTKLVLARSKRLLTRSVSLLHNVDPASNFDNFDCKLSIQ